MSLFQQDFDGKEEYLNVEGANSNMVEANNLVYLRARYYDPALGRFPNLDPVEGTMENPQSLNRYSYVQDNPVNLTDPSGLTAEQDIRLLENWNPCSNFGQPPFEQDINYCNLSAYPNYIPPHFNLADCERQIAHCLNKDNTFGSLVNDPAISTFCSNLGQPVQTERILHVLLRFQALRWKGISPTHSSPILITAEAN